LKERGRDKKKKESKEYEEFKEEPGARIWELRRAAVR
jgi:hypothetical protein